MTPHLDMMRRKAKTLRRDFAAGDGAAVARVAAVFPDRTDLKHADALHVIAREEGHESWPKLKLAVEIGAMDRAARAERLKIALYLGQPWIVESLLAAEPDLADANFGLQVALYRTDAVREALARDPGLATRAIGPRRPILHLAFSRWHRAAGVNPADALPVAEALIAHGADVNDSYPAEPGSSHMLSALYGAVGHAGNIPLAEWLLEHGATPDDNESLYHSTELPHLDGVRLLLKHGVRISGTNALARMLDFDNLEGVRLLLEAGADPNEAVLDHPSGEPIDTIPALHQAARRWRDGRFAELLLAHGADPTVEWNGRSPYEWASAYGNLEFAGALERAGHGSPLSDLDAALARCATGEAPSGRPLAGLDSRSEEARVLCRVVLEQNRLPHAKALVAAGIDPNVTEEMGMPPVHLAGWAGLREHLAWLLTLDPDLTHVNDYGGDLVGTIVHGSENRLDVGEREHVACLRLALEAGAPLRRSELQGAMNENVVAFLSEWAEAHPEQVVEDG